MPSIPIRRKISYELKKCKKVFGLDDFVVNGMQYGGKEAFIRQPREKGLIME